VADYFCFACRFGAGYQPTLYPGPLLATTYQQDKHRKHVVVDPQLSLQSVFNTASTSMIRGYVETGLKSGPIEIDSRGRVNFLSPSTNMIGTRFENGIPIEQQDVTKIVLSSAADRRHQFSVSRAQLGSTSCVGCGVSLFTST
jgi:hypothetical protein